MFNLGALRHLLLNWKWILQFSDLWGPQNAPVCQIYIESADERCVVNGLADFTARFKKAYILLPISHI